MGKHEKTAGPRPGGWQREPKPDDEDAVKRTCLQCGKPFLAASSWLRLCPHHRRRATEEGY
jgi:hypothetical protein